MKSTKADSIVIDLLSSDDDNYCDRHKSHTNEDDDNNNNVIIDEEGDKDDDDDNDDDDDDEVVILDTKPAAAAVQTVRAKKRPLNPYHSASSHSNKKQNVAAATEAATEAVAVAVAVAASSDCLPTKGEQRSERPAFGAKRPLHIPVPLPIRIDNDSDSDSPIGIDTAIVTPGTFPPRKLLPRVKEGIAAPTGYSRSTCTSCAITQHIQQSDKWSCGYRNLQMLLSALLPQLPSSHTFFQSVPSRSGQVTIPSLRGIQTILEHAWRAGFDTRGATHFRNTMVGKKVWIGAMEVASIISFWGLDGAIVQFIRCFESRSLLPQFVRAYFDKVVGKEGCPFCSARTDTTKNGDHHHAVRTGTVPCAKQLLQFASAYSSDLKLTMDMECDCSLPPLYLQWEGHSVCVVGVDGPNFLIFDPLKRAPSAAAGAAAQDDAPVSPWKLPICKIKNKDTQILMVSSLRSLSTTEQASRKGDDWILTAAQNAVMKAIGS